MIGRVLQWLRAPGLVRPFEYYDTEEDQLIRLRTSRFYTVLSIGDKELFFVRDTGKLDGAGAMSRENAARLNHLRAARTLRSRTAHD